MVLLQHLALLHNGHLQATYHIFGYLKHHENSKLVFDDAETIVDKAIYNNADWLDIYGNISEEMPLHMLSPQEWPVPISCFVDANHTGNLVTWHSYSGILIYVQNSSVVWFSKQQNTVEVASFGSRTIVLQIAK